MASLVEQVIERDFSRMNKDQFKAVTEVDGPVLVLAGAGSGKTTVLVNRIACILKYGNAYKTVSDSELTAETVAAAKAFLSGNGEAPQILSGGIAKPYEILAITFTNKAANELKTRIAEKVGDCAADIWAGTFHSVCGKILRRNAQRIGYTSHFTVYDTDDQKRLIKDIMKQEGIDEKMLPYRSVLNAISSAKDKLIPPEEYANSTGSDYRLTKIARLYSLYNARLINNDAMDFDDMISNTVRLFNECPDVLEHYSRQFRYIMVDEYQDTNYAQYMLVKLLAQYHGNICVVGDDDQSIYRFRGATIENILNFESEYKDAKLIKLQQNYRSTTNILDAANAVIKNNKGRKGKKLWTDNGKGELIEVYRATDERDEAGYIANTILENVKNGKKFSDHAVLYRMNAQSNSLENVFARSGITYKVIGGQKFFERKEIKDVLSYLAVISNPYDDLRLKRIINEPKRGIGDTTVNNAVNISDSLGISLFEVFKTAADYPLIAKSAAKLSAFCNMIDELRAEQTTLSVNDLLKKALAVSGYIAALKAAGPEEHDRIDNINELSTTVLQYEQEAEEPSLSGFLEEIALFSDIDALEDSDYVVLMTVHSAKGLEFDTVFLPGMEEGIFPGNQSINAGEGEIEEERRLAYVAITRAKRRIYITSTYSRMLFGCTNRNNESRFLKEIPDSLCNKTENSPFSSGFSGYGIGASKHSIPQSTNYGNDFAVRQARFIKSNPKKDTSKYAPGMEVEHSVFGKGTVISVTKMADDSLLEIAFENAGTKKIMANFAKLKII